MCISVQQVAKATKDAKMGIAHEHKHDAKDAAAIKEAHAKYDKLAEERGCVDCIEEDDILLTTSVG